MLVAVVPILLANLVAASALFPDPEHPWPEGGLHLPLYRTVTRRDNNHSKRDASAAAIGLGNVYDVTYNILIQVGDTLTPLVLDSGSADLWVISDACIGGCSQGVPLYPHATFHESGLNVRLLYGDSLTSTQAFGPIGSDTAGVAGLTIQNQYFAAVINTNTTVGDTGSAGIFGLGFPPVSVLWRRLIQAQLGNQPSTGGTSPFPQLISTGSPTPGRPNFPDFSFLRRPPSSKRDDDPSIDATTHSKRQTGPSTMSSSDTVASFANYGPLITRFILQGLLINPIVATTLQRGTVDVGGNLGQLSIGALPAGVSQDSLTWVPVRGYNVQEGGLPAPADSPNEVYPLVWEVPLDDVWFNGVKLDRSTLGPGNIALSALIDTGNSLIRGPQDVLDQITSLIGGQSFDCSQPQNLTFQIGGKMFPVDPRDFLRQMDTNRADFCTPALAPTDPPGTGFLYSWNLGDPFLKSVLVAYYYGNLTHPSQDAPRVGFLSTVPSDAGDKLKQAVQAARAGGGTFPAMSEPAPTGTITATATGVAGVPLSPHTAIPGRKGSGSFQSAKVDVMLVWSSLVVLLSVGVGMGMLVGS